MWPLITQPLHSQHTVCQLKKDYLLFNWLKEQNRQVLTLTDECHADIADIIVNIALVVCYKLQTFLLPSDNICCLGLAHQGFSAVVVKLAIATFDSVLHVQDYFSQ